MKSIDTISINRRHTSTPNLRGELSYMLGQLENVFVGYNEDQIIDKINTEKLSYQSRYGYDRLRSFLSFTDSSTELDRSKILSNTYFLTAYKNQHCRHAIKSFYDSINNKTGYLIQDSTHRVFYLKKKWKNDCDFQETSLNLSNKQYGDVDTLSDLLVNLDNRPYGLVTLDRHINFQQASSDDVLSDWMDDEPGSIRDICDYVLGSSFINELKDKFPDLIIPSPSKNISKEIIENRIQTLTQ